MKKKISQTSLQNYTEGAIAIAWDKCHKIYILADEKQTALMREYGYDPLFTKDLLSPAEMAVTVRAWYNNSCDLKFIQHVKTDESGVPVFTNVVGQFE